ncbi:hypothetical protein Trydic_g11632 [Trypoxylus dichotomus]
MLIACGCLRPHHAPLEQTCRYWLQCFISDYLDINGKERDGLRKRSSHMRNSRNCLVLVYIRHLDGCLQHCSSIHRWKTPTYTGNGSEGLKWDTTRGILKGIWLRAKCCFNYKKERAFLRRIITGDEIWIHYDNFKCKRTWIKPGEPDPSTPNDNTYGLKTMFSIW